MKNKSYIFFLFILVLLVSCNKEDIQTFVGGHHIISNDGVQARQAYTDKGYTEIEVSPIVKISCYFQDWDKDVMTPVSGLLEYYDADGNWVASINFGDGSCDQWATKTWNVDIFPDQPSGTKEFSVFYDKEKK